MTWIRLLLTCLVMGSCVAATREVTYTAAIPSDAAFDLALRSQLQVGTLTVTVDDATAELLDVVNGWGFATLRSVFRTNAVGQFTDALNLPTADPARYQLDHFVVSGLYVSVPDGLGSWTNTTIMSDQLAAAPVFSAQPRAIAGEFYWYAGSTVNIIDIQHGTPFVTPADAIAFNRRDLWIPEYQVARARENSNNPARPDFGLVRNPTRSVSTGSYRGGQFLTITGDHIGYVFNGAEVLVNGTLNPDPYRLEGAVRLIQGASAFPNNTVGWQQQENGAIVDYAGRISLARPDSEVAEPWRSQFLAAQAVPAPTLTVATTAANRTNVDGQDTQELINSVQVGRSGDAADQTNTAQVTAALSGSDYLQSTASGGITTADGSFTDPTLVDLKSSIAAGVMDQYTIAGQQTLNDFAQATPETQTPPAADVQALQDSIRTVDAQIYQQTPTSLPLAGNLLPRYAEMNPAGYTPDYLTGDVAPEGDNPNPAAPTGNPFGNPAYDLDGDGDRDRMYSTDPYLSGFDQIVIEWHCEAGGFRLHEYPNTMMKNTFAVYGQNHTKPEARKLLYCGYDPLIWTSRQDAWWRGGKTYHDFALETLVEPTGTANEYLFALKYIGHADVHLTPDPPPVPTTVTKSWRKTVTVTMPDGTTTEVPTEEGTETAYLYPDTIEAADLANATFSDPAFIPVATAGRPTQSTKYVRTIVTRTVNGGTSAAGAPVTTVVYFPSEFNDALLAPEPVPIITNSDNAWMWDYAIAGDGLPSNYRRGRNFPRGRVGVVINDPTTIARFGGELPLMSATDLAVAGGIQMTLRETPEPNPPFDADPVVQSNLTAAWLARRSMTHIPNDSRTDRHAGGDATANHWNGKRTFNIVGGAGYYLFKGQWISVTSHAQERRLIRDMWDWDLYQPPTVYAILHVDNDPSKPLLNTVRAPEAATSKQLLDPTSGVMAQDLSIAGNNLLVNAQRRKDLVSKQQFFFSAARGREHEIEMALHAPISTDLHCVEWDDFNAVQRIFAGYNVTYHFDNESERKQKASFCTQILGRPLLMSRLAGNSTSTIGATDLLTLAAANPGHVIFQDLDLMYGKPACFVPTCALLDDEQYGDPRKDQWVANYKVQFRHPMAIFYDDRWSAVVVAYGSNADPRKWCAKWDSYANPTLGIGIDACQLAFESWATQARLEDLYDRKHASDYALAAPGNVTLPPPPTLINKPIPPIPPPEWSEGPIDFPLTVADPGPGPTTPPPPVWTKPRNGWGITGGTVNSDLSALDWAIAYPDLNQLQAGHDQWLQQFTVGASSFTITPKSGSNWGQDVGLTWAYVTGTRRHWMATYTVGSYPEMKPAFTSGQEFWNVFSARTSCSITFGLDQPTICDLTSFSYDDTQVYVDGVLYARYNGDISWSGPIDRTFRVRLSAGNHVLFATTDSNNSGLGVRGLLVRIGVTATLAKAIADADLAAYQAYLQANAQWTSKYDAYQVYLQDLANAQAKLARYRAFEASRVTALAAYQAEEVAYQIAYTVYAQYLAELAAWNLTRDQLQPAIDRWATYAAARSAVVFLVSGRIQEPGVTWSSGEPTWDMYQFWRSQPECSCP